MSLSTYKPVATMITCREDDEEAMVTLSAYRELERENAALRAALVLIANGAESAKGIAKVALKKESQP